MDPLRDPRQSMPIYPASGDSWQPERTMMDDDTYDDQFLMAEMTDTERDENAPLLGSPLESPLTSTVAGSTVETLDMLDIVQFALPVFVAHETQGKVDLNILRIGLGKWKEKSVCFKYHTEEGSAKAGVQFEHVSGVVEMGCGQSDAVISVPIKDTKEWYATLEFKVVLTHVEGCSLATRLRQTRVKIIDTTPFPDESFADEVAHDVAGMRHVNALKLFPAFIRFLLVQDGIQWRTAVMLAIDVLKNLYLFVMLNLQVYLVDEVFNLTRPASGLLVPGSRLGSAYVISFVTLTPKFLFFALDHLAAKMDVKGLLRQAMTRNLFRKFMDYSHYSQDQIPIADMVTALNQDMMELTYSYSQLIKLCRLLGEVCVSLCFTLHHNPDVWWAAVAVPSVMMLWALLRASLQLHASEDMAEREEILTFFVNEVLQKLGLVSSYQQRPQMNDIFEGKTAELRFATRYEKKIKLNNMFVPQILGPAMVALYTGIGADLVLKKELKLGVFLATTQIFASICLSFEAGFGMAMKILSTLPALKDVFVLLNMPTDTEDQSQSNDIRLRMSARRRKELPDHELIPTVDQMQIEVLNVDFAHSAVSYPVFRNINYKCEQGKLCLLLAESGGGRQTMLQLLSHQKFPTAGTLFVPAHLRIIYVSRQVVLMNLSAWENLTFGTYGNRMGSNPYRVEKILRHFDMVKVANMCSFEIARRKNFVDGENHHDGLVAEGEERNIEGPVNDLEGLREAEQATIHLARALIMNPEVLVMHRPFSHYHGSAAHTELEEAMTGHRDQRGLHMPEDTIFHRRPRTIFYSADRRTEYNIADWIWQLPSKLGGPCNQFANTASFAKTARSVAPSNVDNSPSPSPLASGASSPAIRARDPWSTAEDRQDIPPAGRDAEIAMLRQGLLASTASNVRSLPNPRSGHESPRLIDQYIAATRLLPSTRDPLANKWDI